MSNGVPNAMTDLDGPVETFEVVSNGDLLLVAGAKEVPILVSSHCFKTASKPFAAMLQPVFQEGVAFAARQSHQPFRLKLPEDDAEALTLLALILHFKAPIDEEASHAKAQLMVKLTILADKYDCLRAIYFYVSLRVKSLKSLHGPALCAAYLIDNAHLFYELSEHMVTTEPPLSVTSRRSLDPFEILPVDIWIAIAEQQRKAWAVINEEVCSFLQYDERDAFGTLHFSLEAHGNGSFTAAPASWFTYYAHAGKDPDQGCMRCAPTRAFVKMAFIQSLSVSRLWPLKQNTSIEDVLRRLEEKLKDSKLDLEFFHMEQGRWYCPKPVCGCKIPDCAALLATIHEKAIRVAAPGICMDCVKGSGGDKCRVKH